ncbi:acyl-CoA dehydrogenase family protein [Actinomadura livida]|uniref:Acyl-CoA dehydrogenase n=1 Tax=Actinomadura livida TaxID=79909 RepID=A0A7W7MVE2_9ACTN|nr:MULTISPECIES: acyl-CoA dehydrogenase family protein [Actinomadura]MBB4771697.1 acyl-CoA dehydrogenase [Actinomadura catellatispora]GGU01925.1 acyl-CoA dehydrogenase [Actinomadura livida]
MSASNRVIDSLRLDDTFLDEEHRALRGVMRRFVQDYIVPRAPEWESALRVPDEVFTELGALGFLGLSFPAEHGGGGAGTRGAVVFNEELGRSTFGGVATSISVHTDYSALHVSRAGDEEQRRRFLPDILSGRKICALAVTEPDASSDLTRLAVRARRDGDAYVLDGRKTFITNANIAGLFFVVARTGEPGRHGLSLFVVERGTPGLSNGRTFEKTGWRSSDTGELVFDGCRIPARNRLGEEGEGFRWMMRGLDHERIGLAAQAVGLGEAALAETAAWLHTRPGYGGKLWDLQALRHEMARLTARLASAKTLLYHTAALADSGQDPRTHAAVLKSSVPEIVNELAYKCVQFNGGNGFVQGSAVERIARDARFLAIGGGSTEVMLDEIARLL